MKTTTTMTTTGNKDIPTSHHQSTGQHHSRSTTHRRCHEEDDDDITRTSLQPPSLHHPKDDDDDYAIQDEDRHAHQQTEDHPSSESAAKKSLSPKSPKKSSSSPKSPKKNKKKHHTKKSSTTAAGLETPPTSPTKTRTPKKDDGGPNLNPLSQSPSTPSSPSRKKKKKKAQARISEGDMKPSAAATTATTPASKEASRVSTASVGPQFMTDDSIAYLTTGSTGPQYMMEEDDSATQKAISSSRAPNAATDSKGNNDYDRKGSPSGKSKKKKVKKGTIAFDNKTPPASPTGSSKSNHQDATKIQTLSQSASAPKKEGGESTPMNTKKNQDEANSGKDVRPGAMPVQPGGLELATGSGSVMALCQSQKPRDGSEQVTIPNPVPGSMHISPTRTAATTTTTTTTSSTITTPKTGVASQELAGDEVLLEASLVSDDHTSLNEEIIVNQITERVKAQLEARYEQELVAARTQQQQQQRNMAPPVMAVPLDYDVNKPPKRRNQEVLTPSHDKDDGEEDDRDSDKDCIFGFSRRFVMWAILAGVLFTVAVAVVVAVVVSSPAPTDPPTPSPVAVTGTLTSPNPTPPPNKKTESPTDKPNNGNCLACNLAALIEYDPAGVSIAGSTAGAPANTFPAWEDDNPSDDNFCFADFGSSAVWYRLQIGDDRDDVTFPISILVTTCSTQTTFDTALNVFLDNRESTSDPVIFKCIGSNDDHLLFGTSICGGDDTSFQSAVEFVISNPNDVYYISVSGFSPTDYGSFEFQVLTNYDTTPLVCPIALESSIIDYLNPEEFGATFVEGSTTFSLPIAGTPTDWEETCDIDLVSNNVAWYRFEPKRFQATTFQITTCSPTTNFDTTLAIFRDIGGDGCTLSCVKGNDDFPFDSAGDGGLCPIEHSASHSSFQFTSNDFSDIFYIAVSGFGTATGSFELIIRTFLSFVDTPCPLASAISIALPSSINATTTISGSTFGSTSTLPVGGNDFDNLCPDINNVGSPTAWYQFTTDIFAKIQLTTCSKSGETNFDTRLHIFQRSDDLFASQCEVLCLASNDDHIGSNVIATDECDSDTDENTLHSAVQVVSKSPSTRFYVAVSGFCPECFGDFVLNIVQLELGEDYGYDYDYDYQYYP